MVLSGKRSPLHLDARLRSAPLTAYGDREKLPQSARWHTHGSNAQAVKDWMCAMDAEIAGTKVPNAIAVIAKYFGASVLSKVLNEPEKFYLVLEPTVTSQLCINKNDMSWDQIFAATTYGWGYLEMIYSGWVLK